MLPFLPALILLMLQGPAGLEQARAGRLPAAIESIQRHINTPEAQLAASEEALATLLAFSHDREFSRALVEILRLVTVSDDSERPQIGTAERAAEPAPECPAILGLAQEAFAASQRSRDGPSAR